MRRAPFRLFFRLLFVWLLACAAPSASALCLSALGCSCNVNTAGATLNFGNMINPLTAGNVDSASSITVACGGTVGLLIPYKVHLSKGGGSGFSSRRLASGANTLNYNLYTDNTYTTVWGDATGGSGEFSGFVGLDVAGLAPPTTVWIYGRIPSGQTTTKPGTYSDTITITVTYY